MLRKPPAKRAFSGMVGLPPEPEDVQKPAQATVTVLNPEPAPIMIESVPKKRGPKPKFGVAMTPLERQTRSRTNRKQEQENAERETQQKQDDAKRETLIAELMEIYDRQQSEIVKTKEEKKVIEERRKTDRKQRAQYHSDLMGLSLAELYVAIDDMPPDTHGRLTDERSGESGRKHGQSEIERLLSVRQHDSSLFEDEDQDPNLAAGFKTKPEGAAPESFDMKDSTADIADKPMTRPRIPAMVLERQKNANKKMLALVHEAFDESGHCHVPDLCMYDRTPCTFQAKNTDEALEHLWAKFYEGERLWDHVEKLSDPDVADTLQVLLSEARKNAWANTHHWVVTQWMQKYRRKHEEPELRDMQFQALPTDISPVLSAT